MRIASAFVVLLLATGAPVAAAAQEPSATVVAAAIPDLSGLWVVSNRSSRGNLDENLRELAPPEYLTEAGKKAVAEVRPALDPSAQCLPAIPRHIPGPYPIEILQRSDRLAMLFEWDTVFRMIYTDGRSHPDPEEDQRYMGHAVGHWEGETLVVDTANFNGKTWLEGSGVPMSAQAHLIERYSLEDDGKTLHAFIRIEDPVYLSRPIYRNYLFNLRNDWEIKEYLCAEGNRDNVFQPREGLPGALELDDVLEAE